MSQPLKKMKLKGFNIDFYKGSNDGKYKAIVFKNGEKMKTTQPGYKNYQ